MELFTTHSAKFLVAAVSGLIVGVLPLHALLLKALPDRPRTAATLAACLDVVKVIALYLAWRLWSGFWYHDYIVLDWTWFDRLLRDIREPASSSVAVIAAAFVVVAHGYPLIRLPQKEAGVMPFLGLLIASVWPGSLMFLATMAIGFAITRQARGASFAAVTLTPVFLMLWSDHFFALPFAEWLLRIRLEGGGNSAIDLWFGSQAADSFHLIVITAAAALVGSRIWLQPRRAGLSSPEEAIGRRGR
jgi:glycerol-3-phosphate acyltransferase PlsY